VNPLAFAVGGLTLAARRRGGEKGRLATYAALAALLVAGLSVAGALAGFAGVFRQDNLDVVARAVPLYVGLAAALASGWNRRGHPRATA
jgi:hypothetical protein